MHRRSSVRSAALAAFVLLSGATSASIACSAASPGAVEPESAASPAELGLVKWNRGFESATKLAADRRKPLFILFSEVPGCVTCRNYGRDVMSHPLIVEAAETLFVPIAVYNNIEGDDRRTLDSFKEPTWNNPVVRVVAADRTQLAPRVDGDYSVGGVAHAMTTALKAAKLETPIYLALLDAETHPSAKQTETAVFAVHCFWEGDEKIGALDGVLGTTIGFLDGQEVVQVRYDPARLSFTDLRKNVSRMSCATRIYAQDDAQAKSRAADSDDKLQVKRSSDRVRPDAVQKYHLSHTAYRFVPMTELQASRVNSALASSRDPAAFLSPRQRDLHALIEKHTDAAWPVCIGSADLPQAWRDAQGVAAKLLSAASAPREAPASPRAK